MIELFSQEELEQIKKELRWEERGDYYKNIVIERLEESEFADVLFPAEIHGIRNAARNYRTISILTLLTDAITGTYALTGNGFCTARTLNKRKKPIYEAAYKDIVAALKTIFGKYQDEREESLLRLKETHTKSKAGAKAAVQE